MIEIIDNIFNANGFSSERLNEGVFYKSKPMEQYWIVINHDIDVVIEEQSDIFEACKKVCSDPSLDKNVSMLVLWETDGKIEREEFKRKKMEVEEDPYYFKKYVLGYSSAEVVELKEKIGDQNAVDFISSKLISKEVFDEYKNEPFVKKWYSLLYRSAVKIPFLEIKIGESEGLQSLFDENNESLKRDELLDFNNELKEKFKDFSLSDIKDLTPEQAFEQLSSLAEGEDSGN